MKALKFSSGKLFASIVIAASAALPIVIVKSFESVPKMFEASAMKVKVPSSDGYPEIVPESLSVRSKGSRPSMIRHEINGVPEA